MKETVVFQEGGESLLRWLVPQNKNDSYTLGSNVMCQALLELSTHQPNGF
jgi:hypothetical protein